MKDIDLAQNERMCNFSTLVRCNKKHVISKNDLIIYWIFIHVQSFFFLPYK